METPSQGHGGLVPAATLLPCARPNGSEGNGIGNARGIPPRGVGRRHLFGCQGERPSFRGRTARGSVTISATSLARVQRGGANPGPCARGSGAMSLWPRADWPVGRWLKLALRGEYSTGVRECVKEYGWVVPPKSLTRTFTYPCQPAAGEGLGWGRMRYSNT